LSLNLSLGLQNLWRGISVRSAGCAGANWAPED
jgi:hypothetical protein